MQTGTVQCNAADAHRSALHAPQSAGAVHQRRADGIGGDCLRHHRCWSSGLERNLGERRQIAQRNRSSGRQARGARDPHLSERAGRSPRTQCAACRHAQLLVLVVHLPPHRHYEKCLACVHTVMPHQCGSRITPAKSQPSRHATHRRSPLKRRGCVNSCWRFGIRAFVDVGAQACAWKKRRGQL